MLWFGVAKPQWTWPAEVLRPLHRSLIQLTAQVSCTWLVFGNVDLGDKWDVVKGPPVLSL